MRHSHRFCLIIWLCLFATLFNCQMEKEPTPTHDIANLVFLYPKGMRVAYEIYDLKTHCYSSAIINDLGESRRTCKVHACSKSLSVGNEHDVRAAINALINNNGRVMAADDQGADIRIIMACNGSGAVQASLLQLQAGGLPALPEKDIILNKLKSEVERCPIDFNEEGVMNEQERESVFCNMVLYLRSARQLVIVLTKKSGIFQRERKALLGATDKYIGGAIWILESEKWSAGNEPAN